MELARGAMLIMAFAMALWIGGATRAEAQLEVGFYSQSCPRAEAIVKEEIEKALGDDEGVGADLLRMHFHDCFVRVINRTSPPHVSSIGIADESKCFASGLRWFHFVGLHQQ